MLAIELLHPAVEIGVLAPVEDLGVVISTVEVDFRFGLGLGLEDVHVESHRLVLRASSGLDGVGVISLGVFFLSEVSDDAIDGILN